MISINIKLNENENKWLKVNDKTAPPPNPTLFN